MSSNKLNESAGFVVICMLKLGPKTLVVHCTARFSYSYIVYELSQMFMLFQTLTNEKSAFLFALPYVTKVETICHKG